MGMLSGRASRAVAVEVTALLAGCNGGSASEVDEACVPDQEVVRESGLTTRPLGSALSMSVPLTLVAT